MRNFIICFFMVITVVACNTETPSDPAPPVDIVADSRHDLDGATPVKIWATAYYMKVVDSVESGIPLRNMSDKVIGPSLDPKTWCLAAIEGTVKVEDKVYNYAGVKNPRQTSCSHSPSERVRWKVSPFEFGIGNKNNPLIPFKTIACDQGNVKNSKPWINGRHARFGERIYIPSAHGTVLPDGSTHDGIFVCGDTGGLITGNHIDVFLGGVKGGQAEALKANPFNFIHSSSSKTVEAYILKN